MPASQRLILLLFIPLTLAAVILLGSLLARPIQPIEISSAPLKFDAARALALDVELVTNYPERVVGSPDAAHAREWIAKQFAALGLEAQTMPFSVTVASGPREGVNVYAISPGESDEIIVVSAHYDVPEPGTPGAADNASGVATLLELARIFAGEPHRRTIVFLASDSEEYGHFMGAINFVERFSERGKIVAVLDLDYLTARDLSYIVLSTTGLYQGFTPRWLRQIAVDSIKTVGAGALDTDPFNEYLHRAIPITYADYGVYLQAGIPAVNFGAASSSPESSAEYHTHADTPEKMTESAFRGYGQSAERLVRTLDSLRDLPAEPMGYLQLSPRSYLPGGTLKWLQLIAFAPLFLALVFAWQKDRPDLDYLRPEAIGVLGWWMAWLDGYAVAYALVLVGLLPRYERYPATPNDPFLLYPNYLAVLIIFGTVAFFGWFIFRKRGFGGMADAIKLPYRRTTLLLLLTALVLFVWFFNGFTATALLILPAYLWIWIEPRRSIVGKIANVILAIAGTAVFVAFVVYFDLIFPIGPMWWYLTLGAAYGLFPPLAVAPFLFAVALLIRFIRLGLDEPADQTPSV